MSCLFQMIFYDEIGSITGITQYAIPIARSKDINSRQDAQYRSSNWNLDRSPKWRPVSPRRRAATCAMKNTNDLVCPIARIAHFISLRARTIALCHRPLSHRLSRNVTVLSTNKICSLLGRTFLSKICLNSARHDLQIVYDCDPRILETCSSFAHLWAYGTTCYTVGALSSPAYWNWSTSIFHTNCIP